MSYQALYRVWRPQTFDEIVGQTVIKETLKNAVNNQQTSHAYLLTGPRGTGKTSVAKILSKAVNCPHQTDGNPCNQCEICQAITQGQLSDVIEIDAASNNGVDEIRNLRENVRYAASQASHKVYIIDEVHMLTTGAFNALLKTLEEPPERVIFILATTEPHKIPATIMSRVQRFDFQRLTDADLTGRMVEILSHNQTAYQQEALEIIARAAKGGMRDSLSLLDQALSFHSEMVDVQAALEVSGSLSQVDLLAYIRALFDHQAEAALEIARQQLQMGKQAHRFIEDLMMLSRDLLLTHHLGRNQTLLTDDEIESTQQRVDPKFYYYLIDQLNDSQNKLRFSNQTDLFLEVMTIQLAQHSAPDSIEPESEVSKQDTSNHVDNIGQILSRMQAKITTLEETLAETRITSGEKLEMTNGQEEPITPRVRPLKPNQQYHLDVETIYHVLNEATHEHIRIIKQKWLDILDEFMPQYRAKFRDTEPLAASEDYLLISFPNKIYCGEIQNSDDMQDELHKFIQQHTHLSLQLFFIFREEWYSLRQNYTLLRKENQGQPIELSSPPPKQRKKDTPIEISHWQEEASRDVEASEGRKHEEFEVPLEEETSPQQAMIHKTIEIFGKENVNLIYDAEEY